MIPARRRMLSSLLIAAALGGCSSAPIIVDNLAPDRVHVASATWRVIETDEAMALDAAPVYWVGDDREHIEKGIYLWHIGGGVDRLHDRASRPCYADGNLFYKRALGTGVGSPRRFVLMFGPIGKETPYTFPDAHPASLAFTPLRCDFLAPPARARGRAWIPLRAKDGFLVAGGDGMPGMRLLPPDGKELQLAIPDPPPGGALPAVRHYPHRGAYLVVPDPGQGASSAAGGCAAPA